MANDSTIEQEIKIPVAELGALRRQLLQSSWTLERAATLEVNILLDTPEGTLQAAQQALRLRRYGDRFTLSFKGPPLGTGVIKEREELEMAVGDLEHALLIFERLGFHAAMRYEKERELWRSGALLVHLDHTPMGDFVEVEGPREQLLAAARSLGLDPGTAVSAPYPTLWQEHRRSHPELPTDMVFQA